MCMLVVEVDLPRTHFKKRYDCECSVCGQKLIIAPSMMMTEFGHNSGSGNCTNCQTFLHLKIYPDLAGEFIISEQYPKYFKNGQAQG